MSTVIAVGKYVNGRIVFTKGVNMSNLEDIFGDYLSAYKNTSKCRDDSMLEIALRKREFEENLDDMWAVYSRGNPGQIVNYNKGLDQIKRCGFKVFRNSAGKHKIVIPN